MKNLLWRGMLAAAIALSALSSVARAQQGESCSNATLSGSFGINETGTIALPSPGLRFAGVGRQTFDGNGNTAVNSIVSVNGTIYQATLTGTYAVNPDCTGSLTIGGTAVPLSGSGGAVPLPPEPNFFVIVNGGTEIDDIDEESGDVVTIVAKKQFPQD